MSGKLIVLATLGGILNIEANLAYSHEYSDSNVALLDETLITVDQASLSPSDAGAVQSVVDQYKLWDAGQTLKVCFFGSSSDVRQFFVQTGQLWDDLASINFDYGDAPTYRTCGTGAPSHIRVAFDPGSSWSVVGTDSMSVDESKPTLNVSIQNFTLANKRSLGGTILHELGHALALQHEHQSPEAHCDTEINWPVVYSSLEGPPNTWTRDQVDRNMRPFVSSPRLRVSAYDPKSIMHYSMPSTWFINGEQSTCWTGPNTSLSFSDVDAIKQAYPPVPQQQDKHIANLDAVSAAALSGLELSPESTKLISDAIDASLAAAGTRDIKSGFEANINNIGSISTTGSCSPVATGDGNVTITCTIGPAQP